MSAESAAYVIDFKSISFPIQLDKDFIKSKSQVLSSLLPLKGSPMNCGKVQAHIFPIPGFLKISF